jgi:hypothetical protein
MRVRVDHVGNTIPPAIRRLCRCTKELILSVSFLVYGLDGTKIARDHLTQLIKQGLRSPSAMAFRPRRCAISSGGCGTTSSTATSTENT